MRAKHARGTLLVTDKPGLSKRLRDMRTQRRLSRAKVDGSVPEAQDVNLGIVAEAGCNMRTRVRALPFSFYRVASLIRNREPP